MIKIGFVGTTQDVTNRLQVLEQIFGHKNIYKLLGTEMNFGGRTIETVEKLIDKTDLIFLGEGVIHNRNLFFHTVKEANKVFIDNTSHINKDVLQKCKAYQEEAGNIVASNVSSFLTIHQQINDSIANPRHITIHNFNKELPLLEQAYELVLWACCFLNDTEVRSSFHLITNEQGKAVSVSINLYNLSGKYCHLNISEAGELTQKYVASTKEKTLFGYFYNDKKPSLNDVLKQQINALYYNEALGNLSLALSVSQVMERLMEIIDKKGFLSLNQ